MSNQENAIEHPEPNNTLDLNVDELAEIKERVLEAQYFDASSMAPLTPASVVSNLYICIYLSPYLMK